MTVRRLIRRYKYAIISVHATANYHNVTRKTQTGANAGADASKDRPYGVPAQFGDQISTSCPHGAFVSVISRLRRT